jgi:putative transcriptional regulator
MPFSFNPLWKVLIDRKMTREDLRTALKLSPSTMAKMSKGQNVSMEVIHKICEYLNVTLGDVVEFIPVKKE